MFRKIVVPILLLFALPACSSGTLAPTQTSVPSPTLQPTIVPTETPVPTPIPFSQLDLESVLIQNGDLPAGLSGAQIRSTAPEMFKDVPKADYTIFQQFEEKGDTAGGVAVFVYEAAENIERAYKTILNGMIETKSSSDIGNKAEVSVVSKSIGDVNVELSEVVFIRCNAVVHIRMAHSADFDAIVSYAQRLDKRLSPLVCR